MCLQAKISAYILVILLLLIASGTRAQTGFDCVNYDIARYPKTINGVSYPWNGTAWNFYNVSQRMRLGLNFGNSFFKSVLEHMPDDYNELNTSVKYPIIIFFHGASSVNPNGDATQVCSLFKDKGDDLATHSSLPGRIEKTPGLFTQTYLGETFKYIVATPQYKGYVRKYDINGNPDPTNSFPGPSEVEKVINYLVDTLYANKVDKRRIYLVGYSSGANMIMEYVGSSVARAKRIAAVMPVALCSQLNHNSNTSIGVTAANIAAANLKTWFVYCNSDNCGFGPALEVSQLWANGIVSNGGAKPRLTVLKDIQPPSGLYNCSDTLAHDAWSRAFDPSFTQSFTGNGLSTNPPDTVNKNMYQWFTQQLSAVLPVTLKSFSARLMDRAVALTWITTDETNNASFNIERAGEDQRYKVIATIPATTGNSGDKNYSFTDASPLAGLNFYRLVQNDIDGKKTYLEIRKILNQEGNARQVVVFPNPFSSHVSAFISLARAQKVFASLTDMSGKVIRTTSGVYAEGSSEMRIRCEDLATGVYFLKVEGADFSFIRKVVKQ